MKYLLRKKGKNLFITEDAEGFRFLSHEIYNKKGVKVLFTEEELEKIDLEDFDKIPEITEENRKDLFEVYDIKEMGHIYKNIFNKGDFRLEYYVENATYIKSLTREDILYLPKGLEHYIVDYV